jgi:hypothetical protein
MQSRVKNMPGKAITEIDHVLTSVHDLDAAASLFQRMGFTLSPISRIDGMGISNHLVLMTPPAPGIGNYIELMTAHNPANLPPPMVKTLSGAEGIKSMVLVAPAIEPAREAIREAGFAAEAPFHVRREWVIAPGESVFPEFDVILPVDAPLTFNCCRYYNVELYLRPDWLKHENGAKGLRSVIAVARDPDAVGEPLGRLFGGMRAGPGAVTTSPGKVDLAIHNPDNLRETLGIEAGDIPADGARFIGYVIEVESRDRLLACLDRGGVPYRKIGNDIAVDPNVGLGNLIVFTSDSSA